MQSITTKATYQHRRKRKRFRLLFLLKRHILMIFMLLYSSVIYVNGTRKGIIPLTENIKIR